MLKVAISIGQETGITYIPKSLREEGFVGRVESIPSLVTLTLIKPGSDLAGVERSLKLALKDIQFRREQAKDELEKAESAA